MYEKKPGFSVKVNVPPINAGGDARPGNWGAEPMAVPSESEALSGEAPRALLVEGVLNRWQYRAKARL